MSDTTTTDLHPNGPISNAHKRTPVTGISKEYAEKLLTDVSANPAHVLFPRDQWGFTSAVRKAVLNAAASVGNHPIKLQLLLVTLRILEAHVKARYEKATTASPARKAAKARLEAERQERDRISGRLNPANTETNKGEPNG